MLSKYGTEQVGISAEIALADLSGLDIDAAYRARGREELIRHIRPALVSVINLFPGPTAHIAQDQNPVDFELEGNKTLSVKSNMRDAGKMAPQNIGQPTAATFWERLPHLAPKNTNFNALTYEESAKIFKETAQSRIVELLAEYWKNLFECDYLIHVYEVVDKYDNLTTTPQVKVFAKLQSPAWKESEISFSRTLAEWNESCTVRYQEISIGEFQVHNNRNCFKFRFNLAGLSKVGLV
jgi:hypothetical protein